MRKNSGVGKVLLWHVPIQEFTCPRYTGNYQALCAVLILIQKLYCGSLVEKIFQPLPVRDYNDTVFYPD